MPRVEPPTPVAVRPFKNLEEVIQIENVWAEAIELATLVETLELASANLSTKVALAHAKDFLTDAVTCLRNASTIARRDGR